MKPSEGWKGWDEYATFYDWENARTLGRRDLAFWRHTLAREPGPVLELGCGTGRLLLPLSRAGIQMVGIDRSAPMLARAATRARRTASRSRPRMLRGDIRELPFPDATFGAVMAPYGLLQSLLRERDLAALLKEAARVLRPGGVLGIDLVPDLASWAEYTRRVSLKGRLDAGATVTLVESVRRDRRRRLIVFDEEFIERRHGRVTRHRFSLTFRTISLPQAVRRLEATGFRIEGRYGDYQQGPWTPDSGVWLMLARKPEF
jgi:ubiquinone/menaquinone biosynthesis C-methylase UbiE